MSDITDEAIVYRESEDGTITMAPSFHWFDTGQFLLGNFATFRLLYNLWLDMPFGSGGARRKLAPRAETSLPGISSAAFANPRWCNGERECQRGAVAFSGHARI